MNATRSAETASTRTVVLSTVAFFFLMMAYYVIRPVRDQLGGAVGSQSLPMFYFVVFLVMLALTPVFGMLVARFPRKQLLGWSYAFFILCLLAFVPAFLAQDSIGAKRLGLVFYVWVSVFNLFVVSLFWSFMADIFTSVGARKVFSLIAMAGMAGAIVGPLITKYLAGVLGIAPLLVVSATALLVAMVLLLTLSASQDRTATANEGEPIGGSLWAGVKELWTRPFLRYMAILMVLGDGIGTLAYALMADYVKANITDNVARLTFYNDLDLYTNLIGAGLQLTVTRWLLVRVGAAWALVVPSLINLLLLAAVAMHGIGDISLLGMTAPLLAVMMVGSRAFAYGMTKPAVDALYTRVPRETRYKGKNFIETAVWRFGDFLVTSGVNVLGKLGMTAVAMAGIGMGVSAVATWVAHRAGHAPDLAPDSGHDRPAGDPPQLPA